MEENVPYQVDQMSHANKIIEVEGIFGLQRKKREQEVDDDDVEE